MAGQGSRQRILIRTVKTAFGKAGLANLEARKRPEKPRPKSPSIRARKGRGTS